MRNVNISEGQSIQVLRYANRVPLQFKQRDCAITEAVIGTNWRSYGLSQSRGSLPSGPVSVMVHIASVWVPFTSESKEAIAGYPEIEKELRLGLQAVGRKLGMYLRRRQRAAAGRRTPQHLPAVPGRSGRRGQRHQRGGSRRALRPAARGGQEEDRRSRRAVRRTRPRAWKRRKRTTATTC